jgi:hypothetical protein
VSSPAIAKPILYALHAFGELSQENGTIADADGYKDDPRWAGFSGGHFM